jgi:hypothetical protein
LFLIMFRQIAETVLRKKNYKKDYFLMGRLRIESSPDLSLPPCMEHSSKKHRQIKLFLFFKLLILSIFTQIIAKNCENEHFCF